MSAVDLEQRQEAGRAILASDYAHARMILDGHTESRDALNRAGAKEAIYRAPDGPSWELIGDALTVLQNGSAPKAEPTGPILLTWAEYKELADALPDGEFIIPGLYRRGQSSLMVGEPKAGKSTLCRQLAVQVARGGDVLGYAVQARTAVYMPLQEDPQHVVREIEKVHEDPGVRLRLHNPGQPMEWDRLTVELVAIDAALMIVDMVSDFKAWDDGNNYDEMKEVIREVHAAGQRHERARPARSPREESAGGSLPGGSGAREPGNRWRGGRGSQHPPRPGQGPDLPGRGSRYRPFREGAVMMPWCFDGLRPSPYRGGRGPVAYAPDPSTR